MTKLNIGKILDKAIELNRPDFHVWVDFYGHVNSVSVQCIYGGYVSGSEVVSTDIYSFYTDWKDFNAKDAVSKALAAMDKASQENEDRAVAALEKQKTDELAELARLSEKYA